jgi:YesN/AraC family two-component response regulator
MLSAQSAEQALALLENNRFDAVISDYQMPFQNGLDLLRQVKDRWPATRRIILSG